MKNEVAKLTVGKLRSMVRNSINSKINEEVVSVQPEVKEEKPRSLPEIAIELTRSAHTGLKALESLKSKKMPTAKATAAVSAHLAHLERIFNDIWQNPVAYLDVSPEDIVKQHEKNIEANYATGDKKI
jgi:hypothetical protein